MIEKYIVTEILAEYEDGILFNGERIENDGPCFYSPNPGIAKKNIKIGDIVTDPYNDGVYHKISSAMCTAGTVIYAENINEYRILKVLCPGYGVIQIKLLLPPLRSNTKTAAYAKRNDVVLLYKDTQTSKFHFVTNMNSDSVSTKQR